MIQAIPTRYNGRYFRSRLEARWAVYLDHIDLQYEYEPEGFLLNGGITYLPDFYLPLLGIYLEVKPDLPDGEIDVEAWEKICKFSKEKPIAVVVGQSFGHPVILFHGDKHFHFMLCKDHGPNLWKCHWKDDYRGSDPYKTAIRAALSARFQS